MIDIGAPGFILGVVGAGAMGSGIAQVALTGGITVRLTDSNAAQLEKARATLFQRLDRLGEKGEAKPEQIAAAKSRLGLVRELGELAPCGVVIEAIVENLEAKRTIFRALEAVLAEHAVIASNTSSIPIAELAQSISDPSRVLGLHFFSPVPVMMLVEVVVALDTSSDTVTRAKGFVERLGKRPIETKDRSGFIVNMLLVPYLMAAVRMYEDGFASREDIDNGMKLGCGHPMGPLTLCDFIGLDVLYAVCDSLYEEFKRDEYAPPPLMKRMVASGRLGRKSGRGFYEYNAR